MAYYIHSPKPEVLEEFRERIPFLESSVWLKDKNQLEEVISSPNGDSFFLFHLSGSRELANELVLTIREKLSKAKILYIVEDKSAHDLKTHQLSPVGGDAYIEIHIDPTTFLSMLEGLQPPPIINQKGNRLESPVEGSVSIAGQNSLEDFKKNTFSQLIDDIFQEALGSAVKKPMWQSSAMLVEEPAPEEFEAQEFSTEDSSEDEGPPPIEEFDLGDDDMSSDKDQDLPLDELEDLELGAEGEFEEFEDSEESVELEEDGLELNLGELDLDLNGSSEPESAPVDSGLDMDLGDELSLGGDESDELSDFAQSEVSLGDDDGLSLSDELTLDENEGADIDLSEDAKEKLKEIDAIMVHDASQVSIQMNNLSLESAELGGDSDMDLDQGLDFSLDDQDLSLDSAFESSLDSSVETPSAAAALPESAGDSDLDTSLVSDDLDLGSLNFSGEESTPVVAVAPKEEKSKKKPAKDSYEGDIGKELKEISGAYSGEMERMQATLSNLRSDREELLAKIEKLEEDKVLQQRGLLTMRAELDEKKIELSIVRKKSNDEITDLKDRMKLFEEKRMILEEKNRILVAELDKAGQKNKIDVKKVQMRERELEQKLELLKADSETQIRHRDLKILELKRKLDAMEFDIESISVQEKRSVESRFELEDKLDKAIKTLRNAITVLEDESDNKSGALDALKKNIDM